MRVLPELFDNNRRWATRIQSDDPTFFQTLSQQQAPEYLWIGCSDSRVPANQIVDLLPGRLFVHRNVANIVHHADLNCLSVLSYGIEILHVKHIIVCGHYHCGGVRAVLDNHELGLIDNWLRPLQELYYCYTDLFQGLTDPEQQVDRLCELNVIQQVYNVCRTTVVQQAWQRGQEVAVHGWIYDLQDGLLRDLNICMKNPDEVVHRYRQAIGVIDQPACAQ